MFWSSILIFRFCRMSVPPTGGGLAGVSLLLCADCTVCRMFSRVGSVRHRRAGRFASPFLSLSLSDPVLSLSAVTGRSLVGRKPLWTGICWGRPGAAADLSGRSAGASPGFDSVEVDIRTRVRMWFSELSACLAAVEPSRRSWIRHPARLPLRCLAPPPDVDGVSPAWMSAVERRRSTSTAVRWERVERGRPSLSAVGCIWERSTSSRIGRFSIARA